MGGGGGWVGFGAANVCSYCSSWSAVEREDGVVCDDGDFVGLWAVVVVVVVWLWCG